MLVQTKYTHFSFDITDFTIQKDWNFHSSLLIHYLIAACAAANLAIGTLNGEQDT
jgi:hypothetical protein